MNLYEENPITKKFELIRMQSSNDDIKNDYNDLLNNIEDCIKRKDGYKIRKLLNLKKLPVNINIIDNMTENDLKLLIRKKNNLKEFEELIVDHFNIIKLLCNKNINFDKLLSESCKYLSTFIEIYCTYMWLLPLLISICFFLNSISSLADSYLAKTYFFNEENEDFNQKNKYTIEVLNSIRGKIGKVKGDVEKHGAFVILMFQSIKLCSKLNNMQVTSSFLKIIDSTKIYYSYIPKYFIVLFKNELGNLYLQKCSYEEAEKEFIWAYSNSKKNKIIFRKKILEALIAIRLNKGLFPPKKLLEKYQLNLYIKIIHSIRKGDIFMYNYIINQHSKYFFDKGLHQSLQQINFIVKRNLVRIIVKWWNNNITDQVQNVNKLYKVPISFFHQIFSWANIANNDNSYLETISIISSLIISKYINAYISYDTNILVLSKNDPFPSLLNKNIQIQ